MPDIITTSILKAIWIGMLLGVVSGAIIGLFFHREDWMGGYNSFRRRLTRLGHISFFGLAFVNMAFALTHYILKVQAPWAGWACVSFIVGAIAMPTCCFLTAWRKPFRHFFFIPVGGVLFGIIFTFVGWPAS
jgi:hypothetical protein